DQGIGYETPLVIIYDRHPSLVVKVPEVFPRAKHVFCTFKMNSHVYDKLMEIPLDKWACHASIVNRYGIAYTNHVESWNNMIKDDRALPDVCLVEAIRENLSAHYCKYRKMADDWAARGERFTPRDTGLVRANITKALEITHSRAGTWEYLIKTGRCRIFRVNLKNRVCSCGTANWQRCYSEVSVSILSKEQWDIDEEE
ncbi:hypothetical protein IFM89_022304, partial [Coptis chinensis]